MVLIDYLENGRTIAKEYYASLLDKLKDAIQAKCSHLAKKTELFHHDNASAHASRVVAAKLHDLCFEVLSHTSYSPDLAPSSYFLFLT